MATNEDLPFYGPHEDVDPASGDLVPPAFEREIESFMPIVGEDMDAHGRMFEAACKKLFQTNRFYVNMKQLEQVARKLMDLWAPYNISRINELVTVGQNKVTIHCCLITWTIKVSPVKGRGKEAALRIMAGLDLALPGLKVIKIIKSSVEKIHNNPGRVQDNATVPSNRNPAPRPDAAPDSSPRDFYIISSDGERFPVHKNMLTAASPTLKAMLEAAVPEITELTMDSPALVVKAALAAIYGKEPLEDEAVTNHLESCLSLALDYQLVGFQKLLLQKLTVANVGKALLLAEKRGRVDLKDECLKFVRENGRAVLKDPDIAIFAKENHGLWSDIVNEATSRKRRRQSDDTTHAPLEPEGNRGRINLNGANRQQMNRSEDDQNSSGESLSVASTRDMLSNSPGPVVICLETIGDNCHNEII